MKHSNFTNSQILQVSSFIQEYMVKNNINELSADQCAEILAKNNILSNQVGPKPGFNFRQMLRDGRDGLIDKIEGMHQNRPDCKWRVLKIK